MFSRVQTAWKRSFTALCVAHRATLTNSLSMCTHTPRQQRLQLQSRRMCTTTASSVKIGKMTFGQAYQAQKTILTKCSSDEFIKSLKGIKSMEDNVLWKWNLLVGYLVPRQLAAMDEVRGEDGKHLFPINQVGLQAFNSQTLVYRRDMNPMVLNEWNKLWGFLLQVAFDISPQDIAHRPAFNLDKARQLAVAVGQAMQSAGVAEQLDAELVKTGAHNNEVRSRAVLKILHPLQVSLIRGFGFYGDKGFILAQQSINEYSDDRVVMASIGDGTFALFRRAGIA